MAPYETGMSDGSGVLLVAALGEVMRVQNKLDPDARPEDSFSVAKVIVTEDVIYPGDEGSERSVTGFVIVRYRRQETDPVRRVYVSVVFDYETDNKTLHLREKYVNFHNAEPQDHQIAGPEPDVQYQPML